MSFRVYCDVVVDGKKCNKSIEPRIDRKTNELYCDCGKKLVNQDCLTQFAKKNLVTLGRIHKPNAALKPFATRCTSCDETGTPIVDKKNNLLRCASCSKELELSEFFKKMMLER